MMSTEDSKLRNLRLYYLIQLKIISLTMVLTQCMEKRPLKRYVQKSVETLAAVSILAGDASNRTRFL